MDNRQAKEVLAEYRPGDSNSGDPAMAEALAMAQRDPQLAAWFGKHCAAYTEVHGEMSVPTVSKIPVLIPIEEDREHIIPLGKGALFMILAAIIIAVAATVASRYSAPAITFGSYRDRMARLVQRSYPMKTQLTDQFEVRDYFRANGAPHDFPLPKALEQLPAKGCAVLTWHNQPVSLMGLDGGGNTNLYLFLLQRPPFPNFRIPPKTQYMRVGNLMTASWMESNIVYLLTAPVDVSTLQSYITAQP